MKLIALLFALELAYLPSGGYVAYEPTHVRIDPGHTFSTTFEGGIRVWRFYAMGSVQTLVHPDTEFVAAWPWLTNYGLAAGFRWEWIELGCRHYCFHPVVAYAYGHTERPKLEGGYTEIFARIEYASD